MAYPFLQNVHSFWANNATLNGLLPATSVYTGIAPANLATPYAVIVPVASVPDLMTGLDYLETFTFQISVYDVDPDNVLTLAQAVCNAFDIGPLSATQAGIVRTGFLFVVDPDSAMLMYHAVITYDYLENRTRGV